MWRVSKRQQEGNVFLQEIDSYLFAEMVKVVNDKIIFTRQLQGLFITENFSNFSDITLSIKDLMKLEDRTVILIDSITKEEREIMIEIEGGL
jgi:hypothetical protein